MTDRETEARAMVAAALEEAAAILDAMWRENSATKREAIRAEAEEDAPRY